MLPDFSRNVHCILGLPIDAVGEAQAVDIVHRAARAGRRCFLSTPNLNFAVASLSDSSFRDSVLHSDLNTADGMPIVWIARLLGVPITERVAGSGIFERLRELAGPPLKVFFFGGPEGVAARACEQLNQRESGLRCVGFDSPGFGSVEQMSEPERIARINASGADIVVVSLGAKKGQAWIESNRACLDAPVISHLGAVVNFVAGTVQRAPRLVQRVGLEWFWRIIEEPALWRRYAGDGVALVRLLFGRVLPYAWHLRTSEKRTQSAVGGIESFEQGGQHVVRLSGALGASNLEPLRAALHAAAAGRGPVHLDMAAVSHLDSAALGQLCLLRGACSASLRGWSMSGVRPELRRLMRYACAEYLTLELAPTVSAMNERLAC